jgi:hypothetical protein
VKNGSATYRNLSKKIALHQISGPCYTLSPNKSAATVSAIVFMTRNQKKRKKKRKKKKKKYFRVPQ